MSQNKKDPFDIDADALAASQNAFFRATKDTPRSARVYWLEPSEEQKQEQLKTLLAILDGKWKPKKCWRFWR